MSRKATSNANTIPTNITGRDSFVGRQALFHALRLMQKLSDNEQSLSDMFDMEAILMATHPGFTEHMIAEGAIVSMADHETAVQARFEATLTPNSLPHFMVTSPA